MRLLLVFLTIQSIASAAEHGPRTRREIRQRPVATTHAICECRCLAHYMPDMELCTILRRWTGDRPRGGGSVRE